MIGLRINNYEITSLLGEGGMGAVYLAVHPVMGRKVAVKLLRRELAEDKTLVARFINEARAATAIRHPNIIDVIDVGTLSADQSGLPYMMMEYLEGESLARRLELRGTLEVAEAVDVAMQTASALGAAHAKGIVHRDLKPDNLFLVPDEMNPGRERLKVLDFGIAKLRGEIGGGSVKTNAGSIMGTPPYMSPEQCRGIVEDVDHRTDIYALGIILYEMLCGAPPFVSAGYGEVLVMHLTHPPPSPRARNPAIPEVLDAAILRALAKTREARFGSMSELQAALTRIPTAHRLVREPTPIEIAPTMVPTPTPPPRQAGGSLSGQPPTPKSTTFSATTGMVTAIGGGAPRRRGWLVAGAVATLVVAGGVAARTMLTPPVATVHSGGVPLEPLRVVPPPPPAPAPVVVPPPVEAKPAVAAPEPPPAEAVKRAAKRSGARKPRSVAGAPVTPAPALTPPPSAAAAPAPPPSVTAPPAPPPKKPAEKW